MIKQVFEPKPDRMNIGLSLSLCIKDICDGRIPLDKVACIVAGTSAITEKQWNDLLNTYGRFVWYDSPVNAVHYVRYLKNQGLIIQPRLVCDTCTYNIAEGHWLVQEDCK